MRARSMTRDFWRPSKKFHPDAVVTHLPEIAAEVWTFTGTNGRGVDYFGFTGFGGKRSKPDEHLLYADEGQRDRAVEGYIKRMTSHAEYIAKKRSTVHAPHTLEVGSLLYSSWGYDQTNIDFYAVTALHGKTMVTVERIGGTLIESDGYGSDIVAPNPEARSGEFSKHRVSSDNSIRIESYAHASPTSLEGRHRETSSGWGH